MTDLKKIKLEDLRCESENIDLDYYIEFRESVRSRMDEPEWLGEIPKNGLEEIKAANAMLDEIEKAMLVMNEDGSLEEF